MSTFLVDPPPFEERVSFMDALERAGIDYAREPEGYFVFLRQGQGPTLHDICCKFHAKIVQDNSSMLIDL